MSPIATVEEFLRALEALEPDKGLALAASDMVYENVPLPPARGIDAVGKQLRLLAKLVDRFEIEMKHIAERDGVVLTERLDTMVIRGAPITIWVCGTFEVRDGKITYWRDYFDWAALSLASVCAIPRMIFGCLGR